MNRRRRRRRAAITLTLVALLLLGTFAYAAAHFQGWVGTRVPKPTAASPSCRPVTPVKALAPGAVTLNVYNATTREGLAASTAKSLRAQGFKVAKIANDPLGRSIKGVGEMRHGPNGAAGATLAATRLSGAILVLDKRTDATIDLVLGNTFKALSAPSKAAPSKAAPSKAAPSKAAPSNSSTATPSPASNC